MTLKQLLLAMTYVLLNAVPSYSMTDVPPTDSTSSPFIYDDPRGDTAGPSGHDIAYLSSSIGPDRITFEIGFFEAIAPASALGGNSLVGYLDFDLDQSPLTGAMPHQNLFGSGGAALGIEMFVDLFSEEFTPGRAEIIDTATMLPIADATLIFEATRVSIDVPLSAFSGDFALNYGVVVGNFLAFSDEARNSGLTPASTVPEPTSSASALPIALILLCRRWRIAAKR
jgi:hypothetical protein